MVAWIQPIDFGGTILSCVICFREVDLYMGQLCLECIPAWYDANKKHLLPFGCVMDGCSSSHINSNGMCKKHCLIYWEAGGKSPSSKSHWFNSDGSRKRCSLEGCNYVIDSNGVCKYHHRDQVYAAGKGKNTKRKYTRRRDREGNPLFFPCSFEGCGKPYFSRELCAGHYYQVLRGEELSTLNEKQHCAVPGCTTSVSTKLNATGICAKHRGLSRRFNLSDESLFDLHRNRRCENNACGSEENLHLDHDHACCPRVKGSMEYSCGKCVRGWLCRSCNLALGQLKDSPGLLRGLADYVTRS